VEINLDTKDIGQGEVFSTLEWLAGPTPLVAILTTRVLERVSLGCQPSSLSPGKFKFDR